MNFNDISKSFAGWRTGQVAGGDIDTSSKISVNLLALEERILYSAAPLPVDLVDQVEMEHLAQFEFVENTELYLEHAFQAIDAIVAADDVHGDLSDLPLEPSPGMATSHTAIQSVHELVVVDESVDDYQQLVDDLLSQSSGERSFEIVRVGSHADGISQISDFLSQSIQPFSAIHLVTHGADGQIQLGASVLNQAALSTFADQLSTWDAALTDDADLLIYGCDVAQTESGEQFVNELAHLIGVDVAASHDVTGHQALAGDWDFEYQVGVIDAANAFTHEIQASWLHDLGLATVDATSEDGSASRAVAASDSGDYVGVFSSSTIAGSVGADIYYELHSSLDLLNDTPVSTLRVNDTLAGNQQWATVAIAANGDMTFVWTSDHSGQLGVYGKIIDADGNVIKSEFEIDQGHGGHNASIAMDKLGNFVVVWESSGDGDIAGDIYGQMFDAFGNTIDSTFQVNTGEAHGGDTSGYQGRADVAMNENNEFIVSWDNYFDSDTESEIFANKYEFTATTVTSLTDEFVVRGATGDQLQFSSSVDINDRGDFVVAWTVDGTASLKAAPSGVGALATSLSTHVEGSTFRSNGSLEHNFAVVNSSSQGAQEHPSVALLENDVVVFVWEGESTLSSDSNGIYQRQFYFDGTPIDATEQLVSPLADAGIQTNISIAKYLENDYAIGFAGVLNGTDGYHILPTNAIGTVLEGLVYSTAGDGSHSSLNWDAGDAIGFSGSRLTFGSPTDGESYLLFDTDLDLDALHIVTQTVTIDTATPTVLHAGDILFSIEETNTTSIPGIATAYDHDILIFRPSAAGNYDFASGSFSVLATLPGFDDIWGLTLVQSDTTIGDYALSAGDILFTGKTPFSNDINLLHFSGGVATTSVLIDGHDVGVDEAIMGIELIEQQTTIGGLTLSAGTLLLSAERNETVGAIGGDESVQWINGGLAIQDNDIYALEFSTTTLGPGGVAHATASLFFDASTVGGLSGGPSGDVDAIALVTRAVQQQQSIGINNGLTVDEGTLLNISSSELLTTDPDDARSDLVYTVSSAPAHGTLLLAGLPTSTFTQDDIDANRISYQHDGSETTTDSFAFSVDDGDGAASTGVFNITINPINDGPVIYANLGMTVAEGQSNAVISAAMLAVSDVDDGAAELTYTVLDLPDNGTLYLNGAALTSGSQFSQADIDLGRLSYSHDGGETAFDSFLFSVIDGGEDGSTPQVATFNIVVNEVNDAPTDLSPGIELNMDGGNNAYFEAGQGDLLAGLNAFTIEMTFSAEYAAGTQLFSYETAAGNDLAIRLNGDGSLQLNLNNTSAGILAGIDYNTLMDGCIVNFAFTWDNTDGSWAVLVDGVVTDFGIGLEVGQTLGSGGHLVFGMDQDSPGGGFQSDEIFSGTYHDIRIWDDVRTAAEIEVNKNHKFDPDNIPAGLIANWQMTELVGGTTIVDLVNPGSNDLELGHASGINFVGSTPTDVLNVDENSPNGTIVGYVMPTDIENGHDVVDDGLFLDFEITDPDFTSFFANGSGAGSQLGPWTVVDNVVDVRGSDWQLSPLGGRVVDLTGGTPLGFHGQGTIEQTLTTVVGQQYVISFAMTGNFEGLETQQSLSVNVDGSSNSFTFNKPAGWSRTNLQWTENSLSFTANSTTTVLQFQALTGSYRGAMIGDVRVTEANTAGDGLFSFNLTNDAGGRFVIDSSTGAIMVANPSGLNHEADTMHKVTIEVTDPAGDTYVEEVEIHVNDVNEAPTLPVNTGTMIAPAATGTVITSTMLNASDVDVGDPPAELHYTIMSNVSNGSLWLSGVELFNGDSFTQQDVNDGNLTYDHNGALVGDSFDFVLADGGENGAADVAGTFTIDLIPFEISGRVLEDVNGDADLSDAIGVLNADVYLYRDNGNLVMDAGDLLVNVQSTGVDGSYTFGGLYAGQTYWVVVDSKTIQSSATINSGYSADDVWAQQTYGDGGAKFGGLDAGVSDDASTLPTAQHVSRIDVTGNRTDVDFGFSFNVVTNTLAGDGRDDDAGANQRSVQGSLRQFLTNANAIDGANEMRFVPVTATNRSSGTDAWWGIAVSRALPEITDEGTTIDGRAYLNDGVTFLNSNSSIHGYIGSVGVGADGVAGTGDERLLAGLDAPELEIRDVAGITTGITANAADAEISYISIFGFDRNLAVEASAEYVNIHHNMIGTGAGSFSAATLQDVNIYVDNADHGTISDNLIGFSRNMEIKISGAADYLDDAHDWTITGNEIRSRNQIGTSRDGIELNYNVDNISIVGNLVVGNDGYGIDTWGGLGNYSIVDNTITGNGVGGNEVGGIRLFGNGSVVQHNLITDNGGAGVNVIGDHVRGATNFTSATGNLITQNSFSGNAGISIDLMGATNDSATFDRGDGISPNGITSDIGAGNLGLDYPELTYAEFIGGQLLVAGQIDLSLNIDRIEFYVASPGTGDNWSGQSFGEGQTYLGTLSVSSLTLDNLTGEFSGILAPPFPGAFSTVATGQQVTSIAIDIHGNTSEFGNDVTANVVPVSVDSSVLMDEDSVHVFDSSEFGFMDTPGDTLERVRIDSLPANGLLFLDGVAVTTAGVEVTGAQLDAGRLSYQPGLDSYGLPLTTFKFSVNDGDVYSSVSATFEIHVTPVNDDPRGTGGTFSTSEDVLLSVDLSSPENLLSNISDVEGDHLTVTTTPISGPANGTLLLNSDGTFSYQPDSEFHGSDSFMYEVVDGNGGSIVATATITITAVNDDPVLSDPGVVLVPENTSQVVTLAATDVDGDLPAYAIAGTGADDALFAVVGNELVFVAAPDFENPLGSGGNTYFVDVIVDDGHSGLDVLTIEIVVVDVMDNPVGIDESFSVDEGGLYTCTTSVLGNDLDRLGQGLTASILVLPSHGIVNMNPDGTFGYQHDGSETTSDLFLYAVIGADGQQDTAEVTVHVNPIQDPTIVNDDGIFVIEPDQAVVITAAELLANDVDPDSTSFQIKLVAGPADGTAYINASGNLVFDPGASFSGVEVLEYVVIADGVTSKPAKVTFDVLPPSSGVPPVEVVVPEEDAAGSEMVVGDTPPPTDEGSVSEPTVNSPSLTSFADPTADTVQSESSQSETDLNESIFELEQQQTTYAYAYDTNILSLENAVGIGRLTTAANGMALSTFDQVMAGIFWSELDSVKQEFLMKFDLTTPTIVASVTSFLTVGYLAWIIRGGVLLTTFMSSVPAWQAFDPLPVIESASGKEDEDDQSIAQMIDKQ